jgi:tetratricopeptide (TPR) repeat protein
MVSDVRRGLKFSGLQLQQKEALALIKLLGATRVATGKLEGKGKALKLTYQVWKTDGAAAGAPIVASGSHEQIVQQLPRVAQQINAQSGGANRPTAACELKANELVAIGQADWKPLKYLPAANATVRRLKQLSQRSLVGAMLLWRNTAISKADAEKLFAQLKPQIADNTLGLCDYSRNLSASSQVHEKPVATLLQKHPNNGLLHAANYSLYFANGAAARAQARQSAEKQVRAAPKSYMAWYELGECIAAQAEDMRKSRFPSQIPGAEWRKIQALYPLWLEAMHKSVTLNPHSKYAWVQVSVAAVFNGDNALGEQALATAVKLDPLNPDVYDWAFQMYQPKWGGNRAKFMQYANQAMANAGKMEMPTQSLFQGYRAYGMGGQVPALAVTLVKANPRDAIALYEHASDLHYRVRDYAKAEPMYRKVLAIKPDHDRCLSSLGDLQTWVHGDHKAAEALYRRAIKADSSDGFHHANLARLLNRIGRVAEAKQELDAARALGFRGSHPVWGEMGVRP